MSSLLRLEQQQEKNIFQNPFRIRIFLSISYSFGVETINTFVHFRSSLKINARFQTKISQVYTRFQTRTARKPYLLGRHISYMAYIGKYPRAKNAQLVSLLFLKIRVDR